MVSSATDSTMNGKGPDNGVRTFVPAVLPSPSLLVGPWQSVLIERSAVDIIRWHQTLI